MSDQCDKFCGPEACTGCANFSYRYAARAARGSTTHTREALHFPLARAPRMGTGPGETEEDFQMLLDFLTEAKLDRVGCFKFSPVEGATANELADQVPEEVKEERFHRFMQLQQQISAQRLKDKIGLTLPVIIDEVDEEGAIGRSMADAPEIDGAVYLNGETTLKIGDVVNVTIENVDEYDMWGSVSA